MKANNRLVKLIVPGISVKTVKIQCSNDADAFCNFNEPSSRCEEVTDDIRNERLGVADQRKNCRKS